MTKEDKGTYLILTLLLVLASILRLYHPFEIPFSNDELGALGRTRFSTFSELISKAVLVDAHPAGVQVFLYYWTKLFGYSEIIVKLPFIVCGILSVYYVFLLGREWFNSTTGLVSAAYVATIQYTIMYSQFARPYSSGLFLSLVMVWYWNKVIFKPEERYYKNLFLYILFSALCAYNHHFSLLFAAIVGFTGVLFVKKKFLLKYVLAGISIFILYIPHLHIFFYQLKIGGIGNWLSKPGNDYIIQYIQYILQYSILAYILAGIIFLFGLVNLVRKRNMPAPYYFISLAWFLLPFLIGFFYSRYRDAVMEYSGLIFTFPFLLYSAFGWLPNLNIKPRLVFVLAICSVNVFALVKDRKYYNIFYQSYNERQTIINDSICKKVGANNLIALVQSNPSFILTFYSRKYHTDIPYTWMPDSSNKGVLIKYLEDHTPPYLTYDDAAASDLLYLPVILNYYPYIVLQNHCQGGTNYIFTSNPSLGKSPYVFQSVDDFEGPCQYWDEPDKSFLSDTISFSGKHSYKMDSLHEWASTFTCNLDKMTTSKSNLILITISLYPLENMRDVLIVASLESHGKEISWSATPVSEFIQDSTQHKWVNAYHAINLKDIHLNYPDVKVHVYIWNKGKKNFYMDDFGVRTMEGNPFIYWLTNKI